MVRLQATVLKNRVKPKLLGSHDLLDPNHQEIWEERRLEAELIEEQDNWAQCYYSSEDITFYYNRETREYTLDTPEEFEPQSALEKKRKYPRSKIQVRSVSLSLLTLKACCRCCSRCNGRR